MRPVLLITRPIEDAAETAEWIEHLGLKAICAPVLDIHYKPVTLPDASACQGLIFSSANGVRGFLRGNPYSAFLTKPVFVVGDHTAEIARGAGFTDVRSASGTMKDLTALIRRQMVAPVRLLHIRGQDVRDNPAILLPGSEGWSIDGITVYAADPVAVLESSAVQAIVNRQVEGVLFYSARSAKAFMTLSNGLDFSGAKAFCLADSVVESLDIKQWAEIRVASRPDRSGMMALVEGLRPMQTNSNMNDDVNALTDAETVIERFGGIRPMATKMNIPVTTVQGWKKRNVIPGNRRDDVLSAARIHNVDLSDIVANENDFSSTLNAARRAEINNPAIEQVHQQAIIGSPVTHEVMMKEIKKSQKTSVRKAVAASASLMVVFAMFAGLIVAIGKHQINQTDERVTALEQQAPANAQGGPTPFAKMMDSLKARVDSIEASIKGLSGAAGSAAGGAVSSVTDGSVTDRLSALESTVQGITGGNPNLTAAGGQLQTLVQSLQGRMDHMDEALATEQKSNSALGEALQGVSPKELKAAAMLIGLNQFRDSIGRNEPFSDDLAMMQNMVGNDDPELNAAITKLAPYAEKGILSPSALSSQLKGLTGDIVVSSVKGDNVSIQDKAMARFQQLVTVEKDGKPVMGNNTQATVAKAQAMLDAGDVDGAMAQLQSLKGPAKETAQPIIDQGQITMMAQQVQGMLSKNIVSQIKGTLHPVPLTAKTGLGGMVPSMGLQTMPTMDTPQ